MFPMKTASDLRNLMPKSVKDKVVQLLKVCEGFAASGKTELRTGWDYTHDQDLWIQGGYSETREWFEAKEILEGLGYKVTFYYDGSSQFVDMYTLISWKEEPK